MWQDKKYTHCIAGGKEKKGDARAPQYPSKNIPRNLKFSHQPHFPQVYCPLSRASMGGKVFTGTLRNIVIQLQQ